MSDVDVLSLVSILLTLEATSKSSGGSEGLATATGFLWRSEAQLFLITNWHNVTGLNPITRRHLGSFTPAHLRMSLKVETWWQGNQRLVNSRDLEIPLYRNDKPTWLEHPHGGQLDCVAIPLSIPSDFKLAGKPINDIVFDDVYTPRIGDDCFILGFPRALLGPARTPIWKRGSIASEPSLFIDGQPLILIDSATRSGMSGSPVIARASGIHTNDGVLADDSIIGTVQQFLGIYSGRTDDDELGIQIGRVWKKEVIEEVVLHGVQGAHPLDLAYPTSS